MIVAIADTGPLIHLDEIDALQLLSAVDGLLIPQTVYEELEAGTVPSALNHIEYELVEAEETELTVDLVPGRRAVVWAEFQLCRRRLIGGGPADIDIDDPLVVRRLLGEGRGELAHKRLAVDV